MSAEIDSESKEQYKRGNVELIRQKLMAMGADWEGGFEKHKLGHIRTLCIKFSKYFFLVPPTAFVQNFLVILVVVSVLLLNVNSRSCEPKREVYYR